jgi:hypothetical protein
MSLRSLLVAPAETAEAPAEPGVDGRAGTCHPHVASAPASSPVLGVVCERADGAALGAAAALLLLARHRLPTAVVALHRAPPVPGAVALVERHGDAPGPPRPEVRPWTLPAPRRLASALCARRLPAVATGRLATVALPDEPDDVLAAAECVAVTAAALPAATVVVVAGPRAGALDEVLARCDAVLVVTPPQRTTVAGLAADALAALGVPVTSATAAVRAPARALGAAGLVASPDLRAALTPALDAVGGRS